MIMYDKTEMKGNKANVTCHVFKSALPQVQSKTT